MADEENLPAITAIVSKVTTAALAEFQTEELERQKSDASKSARPTPVSRPGSASPLSNRPTSQTGSRTASQTGSRTASQTGSRPISQTGSRPTSQAGSRPTSQAGSRPPSGSGTRHSGSGAGVPSSPKPGSRPGSAAGVASSPKTSKPVSRQSSAKKSDVGESQLSFEPVADRRRASLMDRPPSGRPVSANSLSAHLTHANSTSPSQQDSLDDMDPLMRHVADLVVTPEPMTMAVQGGAGAGDDGTSGEEDDDDNDNDNDNDNMGDDADEMTDEEDSDGENEMVVLDPAHPLMQRFQKALGAHLSKMDEKVSLELRELLEAVKNKGSDRENVGVELYGVQQELARHQMVLERNHDQFADMKQFRAQKEQMLADIQDLYRKTQETVSKENKKGSELQQEVETLALRLYYMDTAKEDVRSDIAVMRCAAEKADTEVAKAEIEKQKQDLFVDRLVERVDKLRENIAMYEAQMVAQTRETKSTKDALSEAHMEIEAINLEKKQLFQQWNSSLIGMRRRDEAHAAMQDALNEQQQQIISLENEIEGFKKSIYAEQEQNEKLMNIHNKTEVEIQTSKRLLQTCQEKHDVLKNEYATYSRMLHETEQALNRANIDKTVRGNEVDAIRKQIERQHLEKLKLEDQIIEMVQSELTLDKASRFTELLSGKMMDRSKELDSQVADVENQLSKDTLEISNTRMRIRRLQSIMDELEEEIRQKNDIITRSQTEMVRRNAVIERKQCIIDQHNKKIDQLIAVAGGVELGPLEININSLQKSIDAKQGAIGELQQMWLRDQSDLVNATHNMESQSNDVENLKKQLTIVSQKKLRIEGDINRQLTETNDIEKHISRMQNEMLKLNTHLHKERGSEHTLEQSNLLMENDFIGALREAELNSIDMQSNLDSLKEEKERLLNSLVEAERQIMLWEKKTQLARETRAAVDSEMGQGEIRAMKAEIHRMQVRYTQLMKQQERMIQEMEKAVSRRDTIVTRGEASTKSNKKTITRGNFQRQMAELRKKIKSTISEANQSDSEIHEMRSDQQELSQQLEEKQMNVQQLQSNTDSLDGDLSGLQEQKERNLMELVMKQQRSKYYVQVKEGKYTRLCKTDTTLHSEHQKQSDRTETLIAIIDRLNQEYPHAAPGLNKISSMLQLYSRAED